MVFRTNFLIFYPRELWNLTIIKYIWCDITRWMELNIALGFTWFNCRIWYIIRFTIKIHADFRFFTNTYPQIIIIFPVEVTYNFHFKLYENHMFFLIMLCNIYRVVQWEIMVLCIGVTYIQATMIWDGIIDSKISRRFSCFSQVSEQMDYCVPDCC